MSPEQLKLQELENRIIKLEEFIRSLHNPAQYNPEVISALITVIGNINLNDLNDVDTSGVSNGQVIKYNSSTQKWENDDDDI